MRLSMDALHFDYVIIGAGSAGCVLAARLSEDLGLRVALLEAGGEDNRAFLQAPAGFGLMAHTKTANWHFQTVPQAGLNGRCGYQPRGRVLGGSSAIDAMIYVRGQPQDYDRWADEGNAGWSFRDLLPYFRKAEDNTRLHDDFHGQEGPLSVTDLAEPHPLAQAFVEAGVQAGYAHNPDFNSARQEGVGWYQVTQRHGARCSAAKAYLAPVRRRPNLRVFTHAPVLRVLIDHQRAVAVECVHDGALLRLQARREVLVCAGALQSPQLLMLSGIGDHTHLLDNGIATLRHLPGVGKHLHDHVQVAQVVEAAHLRSSFGLSPSGVVGVALGALQWRRQRSGVLTSNLVEAGAFLRSQAQERRPDLQLHFVVGKRVDHGRTLPWGHGYACHVSLLRPLSRGSVRLYSRDPFAPPKIDPNFLAERDDMERLRNGFRLVRQLLQQPALAKLGGRERAASARAVTDADIERYLRDHADSAYHPVGSCRMGRGPDDVVDAACRVHGLDGLRVVDASVMPHIVSGDTNAATIMLAEKAADLIKADYA